MTEEIKSELISRSKSVFRSRINSRTRGAEAAQRPLAPGPLSQSSSHVVGQNSSAGVIANVSAPLSVGSAASAMDAGSLSRPKPITADRTRVS